VALVVGAGGLFPEDRFAPGGVGLGVVVGKREGLKGRSKVG